MARGRRAFATAGRRPGNILAKIPALRKQGLSVREARAAIDAVFDSIKNALGRHEQVELPMGT